MTTDKHVKRAARELAAAENISYTAARRRLATDPARAGVGGDGWDELNEHFNEILSQHTVFCVGAARQDAIDLGIDLDHQARQVAAQLLDESRRSCRCGVHTDPDVAPWTNYRVVAEFREPLILGGLDGITGFAWQLFDALGMYSGVTTLWEPHPDRRHRHRLHRHPDHHRERDHPRPRPAVPAG